MKSAGMKFSLMIIPKMEAVSDALYEMPTFPPTWDTQPIRSIYPNIFDWLNLQNLNEKCTDWFYGRCCRYKPDHLPDHISS